jgi:wyosine [tRNA(Phe)-imidazoG37] synthetase (radical SAM superfamily)
MHLAMDIPPRKYKHLYGPVSSRRLGRSLGVDIVPYKVCSYDCVYCQLGRTTNLTSQPQALVSAKEVVDEIERWLRNGGQADYITFAGSGEPTLNTELGEMIRLTRQLTSMPIAVLTNGSLLAYPEVREAVLSADLILPSLDAGREETFRSVNRPAEGMSFRDMAEGLVWTAQEARGEIWLEVMLVRGYNDSEDELRAIREIVRRIVPERVQINTVDRPSASEEVEAVTPETLHVAREILGHNAEIIAECGTQKGAAVTHSPSKVVVLDLLSRRPCTIQGIAQSMNLHINEASKVVRDLLLEQKIESVCSGGKLFYRRPATSQDPTEE